MKRLARGGSVFVHAASRHGGANYQLLGAKTFQRIQRAGVGERCERVSIVLLIAAVDDGVERQRILIRRGQRFLDKHAEHATFVGGEFIHESLILILKRLVDLARCREGSARRSFTMRGYYELPRGVIAI